MAGNTRLTGRLRTDATSFVLGGLPNRCGPGWSAVLPTRWETGGSSEFACAGAEAMAVDLSMSVLVVDDYNTMIRIIRNLLKQLGFENIDDASDGSAALNKM